MDHRPVALVTGVTSGAGRSLAHRLAAGGSALVGVVGAAGLLHGAPSLALVASLLPRPPARLGAIRLAGRPKPAVALTFDDGPSATTTPVTLALLDELGLRATFFLLGAAVASEPGLALEVARRGHEVGSHGTVHAHHLLRSPSWVLEDTTEAVGLLGALGLRPRWYRPPYGQVAAATLVAARRAGCEVVLWSGWGREFAEDRPEPVLDRLLGALSPGAILLLHDSDACAPVGTTKLVHAVLPPLAEALARRGLETMTLGELLE